MELNLTKHDKMFLFNYYIDNGSFSNLSKKSPRLYRLFSSHKSTNPKYSAVSLTQLIEYLVLPNRYDGPLVDSTLIRFLYNHYRRNNRLRGTNIAKGLKEKLEKVAVSKQMTLDTLIEKIDNNDELFFTTSRAKYATKLPDYNDLLTSIYLRLLVDSVTDTKYDLSIIANYETIDYLAMNEPVCYKLIKSRIPKYGGYTNQDKSIVMVTEGATYYGEDLHLNMVPTIMSDFLSLIRETPNTKYLTPYTKERLLKMISISGNINRIGLDDMGLFEDLEWIMFANNKHSIKDVLVLEGFKFNPVGDEEINFIPCDYDYEIIFRNYEDAQVLIEDSFKIQLEEMGLDQRLEVKVGQVDKTNPRKASILTVTTHDNKLSIVSCLFSQQKELYYKNKNSLDITADNIFK